MEVRRWLWCAWNSDAGVCKCACRCAAVGGGVGLHLEGTWVGGVGGHGDARVCRPHVQPTVVQDTGACSRGVLVPRCCGCAHGAQALPSPPWWLVAPYAWVCYRAGMYQSLARKVAHARSTRVDATAEALQGAKALKVCVAQCSVAQCSVAQCSVAQCSVAQCSVAQCSVDRGTGNTTADRVQFNRAGVGCALS